MVFLRPMIPYKNKLPQVGVFLRFREDLRRLANYEKSVDKRESNG